MKIRIITLFLLLAGIVNIVQQTMVIAQPIEIEVTGCLGRAQIDSEEIFSPLPDGGECYFNRFHGINEWYALEFENGREVYKKKHRTRKINEVQALEREAGCIREPQCILTQADCPENPDFRNEEHQELCCPSCYRLSLRSERGCIPNPEGCPESEDDYEPEPIIGLGLSDGYSGTCGGRGVFTPQNDIWPSRTGCFNPEERFTVLEPDADSDLNTDPLPMVRVPNDAVLNVHAKCAEKTSQAFIAGSGIISEDERSQLGDFEQIICLADDYIDDADDFCSQYIPQRLNPNAPDDQSYLKQRYIYRSGEGSDVCSTGSKLSGWEIVEVDALVLPVGYVTIHIGANFAESELGTAITTEEHYMPLATELSAAHPVTPSFPMTGTPHAKLRSDLGEYGHNRIAIERGNLTASILDTELILGGANLSEVAGNVAADWGFDKHNIYNYDTVPTDDDILQTNAMGVKAKRFECLKVYIEEWAHNGDCGQIVVDPGSNYSEAHCQWLTMYRADRAAPISITSALLESTGITEESAERSLRSEFFDYENLNHTGWIRAFPNGDSAALLDTTDICTFSTAQGDQNRFWTPSDGINRGKLDFSKRGCPSVSGPDLFPDFACSSGDGAPKINDPKNYAAGAILTTDINHAFGLSLQWDINTAGIPVPLFALNQNLPDEWVEPSYPARSCTTYTSFKDEDYFETPDCRDLTCMGEHDGFLYKKDVAVYAWETNNESLTNGTMWCNFEIPFDPYTEQQIFPFPIQRYIDANNEVDDVRGNNARLRLHFPRVERIRNACGAFDHRGTWVDDTHTAIAHFITGERKGRCDDWKGFYRKEYDQVSLVSWRLPRFDYEFMKAFLECTGPVTDRFKACDSVNVGRIAYNALPRQYGGCGCPWQFDDDTTPNNWYREYDEDEPFGFWCSCRSDDFATVRCNEAYCTCAQEVIATHGVLTVCSDYGPFKRWLKCFYQARAKACPILTRDISAGMVSSVHMLEDPCDPAEQDCESRRFGGSEDAPDPETTVADSLQVQAVEDGLCEGQEEILRAGNMRWQAPEPNYLARLPVRAEAGATVGVGATNGRAFKHHDLVYFTQTRDARPPFMEPMIPWPLEVAIIDPDRYQWPEYDSVSGSGVNPDAVPTSATSVNLANSRFLLGLNVVSEDFAETDMGNAHDVTRRIEDINAGNSLRYNSRAEEAIVGPRGCDIGGWYEMMLYQARCIKRFGLNCICDYNKTFYFGSAEAYVLRRGGMQFETVRPLVDNGRDDLPATGDEEIFHIKSVVQWPLLSRGQLGPRYAPCAQPGSKLWDKLNIGQNGADGIDLCQKLAEDPDFDVTTDDYDVNWVDDGTRGTLPYNGLSEAQTGDFMLLDETIKNRPWISSDHEDYDANDTANFPVDDRFDARYRRHVAYVEGVAASSSSVSGDLIVTVSEYNYGKNMDSCGNTDRWRYKTIRHIHKSPDAPEVWDADDGKLKLCENPDWKDCYEPNWDRIKLYRPTADIIPLGNPEEPDTTVPEQHTVIRPVCYARDFNGRWFYGPTHPLELTPSSLGTIGITGNFDPFFPRKITKASLDAVLNGAGAPAPVPSKQDADSMNVIDLLTTQAWKRAIQNQNLYDHREVEAFVTRKRGRCDPPVITD